MQSSSAGVWRAARQGRAVRVLAPNPPRAGAAAPRRAPAIHRGHRPVRPGSQRLLVPCLVAAFLALPAGASALAPVLGHGDIHFRLDASSFRAVDGGGELELYVELDHKDLKFEPEGEHFEGRVRLSFEFFEDSEPLLEWSDEAEFTVASEHATLATGRTQILQLRLGVPVGVDSVHAVAEDLNARKRGLFHMLRKTPKQGKAGRSLEPRTFPEASLSISDIEFARDISRSEPGSSFYKAGLDIEPNPGRVYGETEERVGAYYEVYDLRAPAVGGRRRYEIRYTVTTDLGGEVRTWTKKLASSSAAWADTVGFEVDDLPNGSYRLRVTVSDLGSDARALIEGPFEVFWEGRDWVEWVRSQDELVPFFLSSPEQEVYRELGVGARQRYLEEFWLSLAGEDAQGRPIPIEQNAVRAEFMRRVDHVNRRYTTPLLRGMHTDMGRVYIKYGEPDEVRREVIPIEGNDLNTAIAELEFEGGSEELSGTRNITDRDARAFEVWVYNYRGNELFNRDQADMSTSFGMKFIFVDDLGTDQNFRLIRSTERMDF